jgi:hypothetical protein
MRMLTSLTSPWRRSRPFNVPPRIHTHNSHCIARVQLLQSFPKIHMIRASNYVVDVPLLQVMKVFLGGGLSA